MAAPSAIPSSFAPACSPGVDPPLRKPLRDDSASLASGPGLGGSPAAPLRRGEGSKAEACRSASYADVAAFEAILGGSRARSGSSGARLESKIPVPMVTGNSLFLEFEPEVVADISDQLVDFASKAAIFRFKGFWPSLLDLHAWIGRVWKPLLSGSAQIYPVARGFFIVKFDSTDDRNAILSHVFAWKVRYPLMAKPWFKDFDPSTESFNKVPLWVRLPNLPLHLWVDSVLEAVGEAIGDFLMVDNASSNVYRTTYARILVEVDTSKGLPASICLASPFGDWNQCLDYEGIPFRCRKCHKTGHLATSCSSDKSRPNHSPSWWKNALDDHYTVHLARPDGDVLDSQVAATPANPTGSLEALETSTAPPMPVAFPSFKDSSAEFVSGFPGPSPALASGSQAPVPPPAPAPALVSPGPVGGLLASGSLGEAVVLPDPPGCSVSSGEWAAAAALVEDGWTTVKGKKSKTSPHPSQMNLRSCKKGSKSKGKS